MTSTRKSTPTRNGPKRKYNTWSLDETNLFLHGLTCHQRDFSRISATVATKDYSQTRDYFYRLLKGVRAALGAPWDKEVLASNVDEVTVLIRAFTNLKAQGRTLRVMKDDMVDVLTTYRRDKTQPPLPTPGFPTTQEQQHHRPRGRSHSTPLRLDPPPLPKRARSNPEVEGFLPNHNSAMSMEQVDVLDSSPSDYPEPAHCPDKRTLMLCPYSALVETFLRSADLNPHLALSVKRSKKVCSIVTYLERKWCQALPADRRISIRLRDGHVSTEHARDNMGTAFTPPTVQLDGFLRGLGLAADTHQLIFEYDFFPVCGIPTAVSFPPQPTPQPSSSPAPTPTNGEDRSGFSSWNLPTLEKPLPSSYPNHSRTDSSGSYPPSEDFQYSFEWMNTSKPKHDLNMASSIVAERRGGFSQGNAQGTNPIPSLSEYLVPNPDEYSCGPRLSLPYLDFEDSRDGFEGNSDANQYEQRCRMHWNEQERSLDYPPMGYFPPTLSPTQFGHNRGI